MLQQMLSINLPKDTIPEILQPSSDCSRLKTCSQTWSWHLAPGNPQPRPSSWFLSSHSPLGFLAHCHVHAEPIPCAGIMSIASTTLAHHSLRVLSSALGSFMPHQFISAFFLLLYTTSAAILIISTPLMPKLHLFQTHLGHTIPSRIPHGRPRRPLCTAHNGPPFRPLRMLFGRYTPRRGPPYEILVHWSWLEADDALLCVSPCQSHFFTLHPHTLERRNRPRSALRLLLVVVPPSGWIQQDESGLLRSLSLGS
ncbi:hypothetical protein J3E69DRAFT_16160 [Trichoderma sp. SZMC 28015]